MSKNVDVPALAESVTEAVLIKWLKADGEQVNTADPIAELETDKANVDLPAPDAGVLRHIKSEGDTVHVGDTIARIDSGPATSVKTPKRTQSASQAPAAEKATDSPKAKAAKQPAAASQPPTAPASVAASDDDQLSPAVRRLAEEQNIDLSTINGTGPAGRITKEDLISASQSSAPAAPEFPLPPPAPAAPARQDRPSVSESLPRVAKPQTAPVIEQMSFDADGTKRVPVSKIRKRIAENLVRAQHTAAILTTFNEVDMSAIMSIRAKYKEDFEKSHGVGLGFMSFFARAVVVALSDFPRINAYLDGNDIIYHQHVNLGIAVSTDRGLAVPVLRNVEALSFAQIEAAIKRLAKATRDGKLSLEELSGGTFTITNGGIFGSLLSTPIINPPQSGILGMHKIQKRAVVVDDQIVIRPMMNLALSYDHRLVDGRESVSFLVRLKDLLEDPTRLMLVV